MRRKQLVRAKASQTPVVDVLTRTLGMHVLDLFSAAAGGWSLGMHRAGFQTVAACENVDWRRELYAQNNSGVQIYDDVRTLTADRLVSDLGTLPEIVVGSPPCQDISSANTKGKGVEGERSGLYFEAIRLVREIQPRWFAFENSANLRTRGADSVIDALEGIGYACWPFVVRASDVGANHERARSWLIGCNIKQVTDASYPIEQWGTPLGRRIGWPESVERVGSLGCNLHQITDSYGDSLRFAKLSERSEQKASFVGNIAVDSPRIGHEGGRTWRHGTNGDGAPSIAASATDADDGCDIGRSSNGESAGQMDLCATDSGDVDGRRTDWTLNDLACRLRVDDGLSAELAGTRIVVGGSRGTSAASLIVEAFGDSVIPQIPEAIGRSILRTEAALAAVCGPDIPHTWRTR